MLINHLNHQLREQEALSLRRRRHVAESACAPKQFFSTENNPPRARLTFCSNDYLGLANHPQLIAALAEGAQRFGVGSGGSNLVSGYSRAHATLEAELAEWIAPHIPQTKALFFSTGFMANLALLTALGNSQATIFSDALNHASIIDGARLAKAPVHRVPHNDIAALDQLLQQCTTPIKLIVTEAVFSMDGDIAPLPEMLALAEKHDAWLIIDDAHGFGLLGPQGRGSLAHWNLRSERFIYMGTLDKAVGVGGAFVVAHTTIIDWLIQSARAYIYTTALSPAIAHAASTSLRLILEQEGEQRRQHLQSLIERLSYRLKSIAVSRSALNWRSGGSNTAIQPLIIGENSVALKVAAMLDEKNIWVPAIRPPTVPEGTARLRIALSAAHTHEDLESLCAALEKINL